MVRRRDNEPYVINTRPSKHACLPIPALALNNMYYSISRAVCQLLFLKTQKHVRFAFYRKMLAKRVKTCYTACNRNTEENTMTYKRISSPVGVILLQQMTAQGLRGCGLGHTVFCGGVAKRTRQDTPFLSKTIQWLDVCLPEKSGFHAAATPHRSGFSAGGLEVLLSIPYGRTMTYGQKIATLTASTGIDKNVTQAVGGAVGLSISIIVPCHRVVGTNGELNRLCRRP